MKKRPTLTTPRLLLRPFALTDAPDVQRLAGAREVASTTLNIPHPYTDGMAEQWIATHEASYVRGEFVIFAIVLRANQALIGATSLHIHRPHVQAELGYWIGKPYWGCGYATEAAEEVVRYGFEDLALNRIHAKHFGSNPASGRVMRKVGMSLEGVRPEHYKKWETYEDRVDYGLLVRDWRKNKRG